MTLETGTRLGPYEIVSLLGRGGMGEVYKARDTRLDREVAVKVLRAEWSGDPRFKQRLEREAKKISQLQHHNVCALYDLGSQGGVDYLVMEYLHGETMESRLTRGSLPIADVLEIGSEIAEAIEAAHRRGVIHRDLKPGNVILTKSGAKVLDFGLARDAAPPGQVVDTQGATPAIAMTEERYFVGTMPYMAPELLNGNAADARADIWALGCVLYEMATGQRPFRGATLASLTTAILSAEPEPISRQRSTAPERLDSVVKRCLAKDPERRWHSARDLSLELEAIAPARASAADPSASAAVPASSTPDSASARSTQRSSPSRSRWQWAAAAAVVLGAGLWWLAQRDRGPEPISDVYAALPFQTMSDDREMLQLAAGIPQEMSSRWARLGWTLLTPVAAAEIATDPCAAAGGRHLRVYHGTVGRFQGRIRVTAQLTDCPEGSHSWGDTESYDATDLDTVQEQIAKWLTSASQGLVFTTRLAGTLGDYRDRRTPADNQRGLELAREAWQDGGANRGMVGVTLRDLLQQSLLEGWTDSASGTIQEMLEVDSAVLADAPQWGIAHATSGFTALWAGDRERGLEALEHAVQLQGTDFPVTYAYLGLGLALTDRPEEGIAAIDEAIRLSPPDELQRYRWEQWRGVAHFAARHYIEARDASRLALSSNNNDYTNTRANAYQILAASLAHLGELKEARSAIEEAVRLRPALTLEVAGRLCASASAEYRGRYLEGLRLAGLGPKGLVESGAVARDK